MQQKYVIIHEKKLCSSSADNPTYTKPHLPPPSYRETVQGAYPLSHSSDRQDARPVEVLVELACFNEFIILNVFFHLLSRAHEVVVLSVHLVLSPRTSSICRGQRNVFISVPAVMFGVLFGSVCCCKLTGYTRTKLVGKLRDKVIIYSVLHWTQYDHRPCVVDCIGDKNQVRIHTKIYSLSFGFGFFLSNYREAIYSLSCRMTGS